MPPAHYSDLLHLDMGKVVPSIAGPRRPQDRIALSDAKRSIGREMRRYRDERARRSPGAGGAAEAVRDGKRFTLADGAVVIAAITSCTNTSNPAVMIGAGLLARNARARGLGVPPWVKTSLAPGSLVVTEYLKKAGLMEALEGLGFHLVGYGCTTCIGNSGPLPAEVDAALREQDLIVCSVLSGNRNFEGRVHADVRMNFLASPPLVVAYALAGRIDIDLYRDPLGTGADGEPVYLEDIWPGSAEIHDTIRATVDSGMFRASYENLFAGDARWQGLEVAQAGRFAWDEASTYVRHPPYFEGVSARPGRVEDIAGARVLALLGDSITTDHISPAGAIGAESPAGEYLVARGVAPRDFNSYGSRRGNHEVMVRGTFANVRLRNRLAPGTEGGWTRHHPSREQMSIYDAAMRYRAEGVPLLVIGGAEYGSGSSRDWAAKGVRLLGVRAVLVRSFERIHRSNLIGMGVLPLQFRDGEDAESLGLTGHELYDVRGLAPGAEEVEVGANAPDGATRTFGARVRIDTPKEWDYYLHGGILHYVLRELAA